MWQENKKDIINKNIDKRIQNNKFHPINKHKLDSSIKKNDKQINKEDSNIILTSKQDAPKKIKISNTQKPQQLNSENSKIKHKKPLIENSIKNEDILGISSKSKKKRTNKSKQNFKKNNNKSNFDNKNHNNNKQTLFIEQEIPKYVENTLDESLNSNADNKTQMSRKKRKNKMGKPDLANVKTNELIKAPIKETLLEQRVENNVADGNKVKKTQFKKNTIVNLSKKEIISRDLKRIELDYGITITIKDKALYNKIRTVIYVNGYEKLNNNFLFLLKKDATLNIKDIYDIYKFEETIKTNFLTKILKIENIFNNALSNYSGLDQKNKLNFSKKIKIFKDQEDKIKKKIISFINNKLSEDIFVEALYLAKDIRNRISHNQFLIKFLYQNKNYELKKIIESLNSISGEEKNFKDVVNKVINEKIKKLLAYEI